MTLAAGVLAVVVLAAPPPKVVGRIPQVRARLLPSPQVKRLAPAVFGRLPELRARIAPRLNPDGKVRRVLYALGASDVAQALALFEGPHGGVTELAIADMMPFGTPAEVATVHASPPAKNFYMREADVEAGAHEGGFIDWLDFMENTKVTGPAIVWELEHLGAERVRIEYLDEQGARRPPPTVPRTPLVDRFRKGGVSRKAAYEDGDRDVVRISFTLNGSRRSILYVQQDMTRVNALAPVLTRFLDRGFDAYLEKAPYGLTHSPAYQAVVRRALQGLDRRHGLVVSDHDDTGNLAVDHLRGFTHQTMERTPFGYSFMRVTSPRPLAGDASTGRLPGKRRER